MPKLTCPGCEEVVKVPDGQTSARCPSCGQRIGKAPPAEEPDEDDEDEKPRPRKRRKEAPTDSGIRGLIALVLLGPLGIALGIGTILNIKVAVAALIVGFFGTCTATLMLYSLYKREGASHMTGDQNWGMFFAQIQLAFARPRIFGSWKFLELLFGFVMLESFTLVVILPKLGIHPHAETQKAAAEQPPAPGPNQPAPGPNNPQPGPNPPVGPNQPAIISESDRLINEALSELDKSDGFARQSSARHLKEMKPKANRQAEVVAKLNACLNDENVMSRTEVIRALGVWGSTEDVPALIGFLENPDAFTREAAAQAVTRFKDARAIPGLIRCLNGVPARAATQALVEIGTAAEKDLIEEISKKNSEAMGGAIDLLKTIGTRASIPALRAIVNDPDKRVFVLSAQEAIKSINARTKKDGK